MPQAEAVEEPMGTQVADQLAAVEERAAMTPAASCTKTAILAGTRKKKQNKRLHPVAEGEDQISAGGAGNFKVKAVHMA
jgi:hypothetical protein